VAGRTIVITGASDGLGAAAAKRLSGSGEDVVVVGRSPQKTKAVATELGADYLVADFTDLAQVRALAEELLARYPRIDVLANNAGGFMGEREVTVDGHEKTFQVNHLAPFLLTTLLLDRLVESQASVLNTSSKAYGDAKLENILFTKELHHRYHAAGISTAAFHPGSVASNFGNEAGSRMIRLVWLASATPGEDWTSGEYYSSHSIARANKQAYDPELARELWDRSANMIATKIARKADT
jgi:NAD(P)-dependent dehydrogenase (short-subunit alcohol dehydrogenase family)